MNSNKRKVIKMEEINCSIEIIKPTVKNGLLIGSMVPWYLRCWIFFDLFYYLVAWFFVPCWFIGFISFAIVRCPMQHQKSFLSQVSTKRIRRRARGSASIGPVKSEICFRSHSQHTRRAPSHPVEVVPFSLLKTEKFKFFFHQTLLLFKHYGPFRITDFWSHGQNDTTHLDMVCFTTWGLCSTFYVKG